MKGSKASPPEELPMGVTVRCRRRGEVAAPSNKENENLSSTIADNHHAHSIKRPLKHGHKERSPVLSKGDRFAEKNGLGNLFLDALKGASSDLLVKRNRDLADLVVKASRNTSNHSTVSFALKEHSAALLKDCRKLMKLATETKDVEIVTQSLVIGLHTLRALLPLLSDVKQQEAALKLLFHAVTSSFGLCKSEEFSSMDFRAHVIVVSSFETVGVLLRNYFAPSTTTGKMVAFQIDNGQDDFFLNVFPIPVEVKRNGSCGTIPLRNVLTIGLQSAIAFSMTLLKLALAPLSQSNLADAATEYGDFTNKLIFQTLDDEKSRCPFDLSTAIFKDIAIPWIHYQVSSIGRESHEEMLTQGRKSHRSFWDAASRVNQGTSGQEVSLRLRQCAIFALLLCREKELPLDCLRSEIAEKQFDLACTSGWKAASSFAGQSSPALTNENIRQFHEEIGPAIDSIGTAVKLSYTEYCAYRALHLGVKDGNIKSLFQLRDRPEDMGAHLGTEDQGRATLDVLCLSLAVCHHLSFMSGVDSFTFSRIGTITDGVVDRFRSALIGNHMPSIDTRTRCYKLLSLASLPRAVFLFLKEAAPEPSLGECILLECAGKILADCMGPFAVTLIASSVKKVKAAADESRFWETAVECYIRSLVALERISSCSDREANTSKFIPLANIHRKTEAVAAELYELLSRDSATRNAPVGCFEKSAKTLSVIGKRLVDRREYGRALLPLVYSIQFFTNLSSRDIDRSRNKDQQLSLRWSHLASVFHNAGKPDAACIALVASLTTAVHETAASCACSTPLDLIHHFDSLTNGALHMGNSASNSNNRFSQLISRLLNLSRESGRCVSNSSASQTVTAMSIQSAIQVLSAVARESDSSIESTSLLFKAKCGADLSLSAILRVMLLANSGRGERLFEKAALWIQLKIVAEIIVQLGLRLQTLHSQEQFGSCKLHHEFILEEFQTILRLVPPLIRKVNTKTEELNSVLLAAFYAIAANSLHPFHLHNGHLEEECDAGENSITSPLIQTGKHIIDKGADVLQRSTPTSDSEWATLSMVLHLVIKTYRIRIAQIKQRDFNELESSYFHLCLDAAASLEKDANRTAISEAARSCALRLLVQLQHQLSFEGLLVPAARIAECVGQLTKQDLVGERQWFLASALSTSLKAEMSLLAYQDVSWTDSSSSVEQGLWLTLARVEWSTIEMRAKTLVTFGSDLFAFAKRAMEDLESLQVDCPDSLTLLVQWVSGSIAGTISEIWERVGDVGESLCWIRKCLQLSSKAFEMLRRDCYSPRGMPTTWVQAAFQNMLVRLSERQIDCLYRISLLYGKLGDHRKSEGYALAAFDNVHTVSTSNKAERFDIRMLASSSLSDISGNRHSTFHRLLVRVKAQAMALDVVTSAFADMSCKDSWQSTPPYTDVFTTHWILDKVSSLIVVGDSLYCWNIVAHDHFFAVFYHEARRRYHQLCQQHDIGGVQDAGSKAFKDSMFQTTSAHLKLREARSLISTPEMQSEALQLCSEITASLSPPMNCRAWANYYLGLAELERLRCGGSLARLWSGYSNLNDECNTSFATQTMAAFSAARNHFLSALALIGLTPGLFTRDVLRCLALVSGPKFDSNHSGSSASALIHSSIGMYARQSVFRAVAHKHKQSNYPVGGVDDFAEALRALDTSIINEDERNDQVDKMYNIIRRRVPEKWRTLAVAMCPTGEILMTAMEVEAGELDTFTVCIFPDRGFGDSSYSAKAYNEILKPLDSIVEKSQVQLRGTDAHTVAMQCSDESFKRAWWKERISLDHQLENLIVTVESNYFGAPCVQQALQGSHYHSFDDDDGDAADPFCSNLAAKFEAAVECGNDDGERVSIKNMSVTELKEALAGFGVEQKSFQRLTRHQLVDLLGEERSQQAVQPCEPPSDGTCLFLLLDENFHRFPFEGMSCLAGRTVCRLPSLPFVVAGLNHSENPHIDPVGASFILDPESNLIATRDRLLPVLESISSNRNWAWEGVIGSPPTNAFVERALMRENGLVLFYGHGAGQSFFPRKNVESLLYGTMMDTFEEATSAARTRLCQASVILMGCSSGRLLSVNRKNTNSLENLPIHFEPEGIALSYLCAGAPCVVGNLWDVTDKDIDRFSVALLNSFLVEKPGTASRSLAHCVADARAACKMRFIVGCAPFSFDLKKETSLELAKITTCDSIS